MDLGSTHMIYWSDNHKGFAGLRPPKPLAYVGFALRSLWRRRAVC